MISFSLIVSEYNDEKWIKDCVDSILSQTYDNFELIIVDDGSTDDTKKILSGYNNIGKVRIIYNEHRGVSYARYTGLLAARNDWIMFIDGDDVIHDKTLEILVNFCRKNSKVVKFNFKNFSVSEDLKLCEKDNLSQSFSETNAKVFFKNALKNSVPDVGVLWGKIYKKEILTGENIFNNWVKLNKNRYPFNFFEDTIFMPLVISVTDNITTVDTELYFHRCSSDGIGANKFVNQYHYECVKIFNERINFIKQHFDDEILFYDTINCFLQILSVYYRASEFSIKDENFISFSNDLKSFFRQNFKLLKQTKIMEKRKEYLIIKLFYISPLIWKIFMKQLYFKKKYKWWYEKYNK